MRLVVAGAIAAETSRPIWLARVLCFTILGCAWWQKAWRLKRSSTINQLCLRGCDQAQGDLFSRAVSADDLTDWIDSQLWRDQVKVACRI